MLLLSAWLILCLIVVARKMLRMLKLDRSLEYRRSLEDLPSIVIKQFSLSLNFVGFGNYTI